LCSLRGRRVKVRERGEIPRESKARDASVERERKGKGSALANSFSSFPRRLYFVLRKHVTPGQREVSVVQFSY